VFAPQADALMTQPIQDSLTKVFRDVFDDDNIVLRPELSANEIPEWDSLTHIRLLLTIEREFRIKFTVTEVGELKNVGDLTTLIETKLSAAK
jgi:acyl carrier protein